MIKYFFTPLLVLSTHIVFSQTIMVSPDAKESALIETPNGIQRQDSKNKRVLNLDSGIGMHPDDIVSDEVITTQIQTVEKAILETYDEKRLFQLNKELINLKAKRQYLKDNNLN